MNNQQLAQVDDNDFRDCVTTGYQWTLYADGRVAAEYITRWQGSRFGQRWTTDAGYVDVETIDGADQDMAAAAVLTGAVDGVDPETDASWRQTAKGALIR